MYSNFSFQPLIRSEKGRSLRNRGQWYTSDWSRVHSYVSVLLYLFHARFIILIYKKAGVSFVLLQHMMEQHITVCLILEEEPLLGKTGESKTSTNNHIERVMLM